ncbi:5-oxoproline transporter, DUF979 family subunit [Sphingobium vermicomposti]|uniref:Putative membrane protein n=1 Tax=Sphingobium vermicomposti TaxID=529005 RepID=A0A846M2V7_9SPHN|nr:DUF979 family protein [Sphingobium vermicomposti]NIJ15933.1 putative membrane protein [Sphingobium vermicomposti]
MIGLGLVYALAGAMFLGFAVVTLLSRRDARRWATALLWGLVSVSFLLGDVIGDTGNGIVAIAIVVVAASGRTLAKHQAADESVAARTVMAMRFGNRLFLPALLIPLAALGGTLLFKAVPGIVQASNATLISLALGAVLAALLCMIWFRPGPAAPLKAGVRLMDGMGWAALMPQMLASLGVVYAASGMGEAVGHILGYVPTGGNLFAQVAIYCVGMALLTALMGNALAAFPVMFAAIGVPLLISAQGGNPAAVAAIGMLAGFCGTLMTPMAANFNLVPAALLNLRDPYGVIWAQMPTAVVMLGANILLLYFLGFPS